MTNENPSTDTELANRFDQLATRIQPIDQTAAARLKYIAEDVRLNSIDTWVGLDVRSVIDIDGLSAIQSDKKDLRYWLILVRNSLILVPLIVTWAAIGDAVMAYQRLLAIKPETRFESFLGLWQSGFDGWGHAQLSQVATVDVILLLIVLGLTAAADLVRDTSNAQRQLRIDLSSAIGDFLIWVREHQLSQDSTTPNRLKDAATQLSDTATQVSSSARDFLSVISEAAEKQKADLQTSMREMHEIASDVRGSFKDMMTGVAVQFRQEVAALQEVAKGNRQAAQNISGFAERVEKAGNVVAASVSGMAATNANILAAAQLVGDRTKALEEAQKALTQNLAAMIGGQKALVDAQSTTVAEQKQSLGQIAVAFQSIAVKLESVVTEVSSSSKHLDRVTASLADSQRQLLETIVAKDIEQNKAVSGLSQVANRLHETMAPMEKTSINLARVVGEFDRIIPPLQATPGVIQKQMTEMVKGQRDASEKLAQASNQLNNASSALEEVSRILLPVLNKIAAGNF